MKRSWLKRKTPLHKKGKSDNTEIRDTIQSLLREIVMIRDGGCILRKYRRCGGEIGQVVIQADHLITRSNSATFADERLVVCLCKSCHGWKHWHEKEYDALVKRILPKNRVELWEKCELERQSHRAIKMNWILEIIHLRQVLKKLSTS